MSADAILLSKYKKNRPEKRFREVVSTREVYGEKWRIFRAQHFSGALRNTRKSFRELCGAVSGPEKLSGLLRNARLVLNETPGTSLRTSGARKIWIDQSGFSRREKRYCPDGNVSWQKRHLNQATFLSGDCNRFFFSEKRFTIPKKPFQIVKSKRYETFFCFQASNLAPRMGRRYLAWQLARSSSVVAR